MRVQGSKQFVSGREETFCGVELGVLIRHPPCTVEQSRPLGRVLREPGRLLEVAPRFRHGGQRAGPLAGPRQQLSGARPDFGRVFGVRLRLVGGEVVGGHDLDDLPLRVAEAGFEQRGGRQVTRLTLTTGERLVGDAPDQVLQEAVLAAFGGARVGLHDRAPPCEQV